MPLRIYDDAGFNKQQLAIGVGNCNGNIQWTDKFIYYNIWTTFSTYYYLVVILYFFTDIDQNYYVKIYRVWKGQFHF